jgi:hypothetical protein
VRRPIDGCDLEQSVGGDTEPQPVARAGPIAPDVPFGAPWRRLKLAVCRVVRHGAGDGPLPNKWASSFRASHPARGPAEQLAPWRSVIGPESGEGRVRGDQVSPQRVTFLKSTAFGTVVSAARAPDALYGPHTRGLRPS